MVPGGATNAPGGTPALGGTITEPSVDIGTPPSQSHGWVEVDVRDVNRNRLNQLLPLHKPPLSHSL